MLVDYHTHLNFKAFDKDREEVITKCQDQDIWLINVGSQYSTSQKAIELAEQYDHGVYAAAGLHPIHVIKQEIQEEGQLIVTRAETFDYEKYKTLALNDKVVALGETGLDYFHPHDKDKQVQALIGHLKLSQEINKPLIFHCRDAYDDLLEILKDYPGIKGVIHGFGGTMAQAQQFMDLGLYIGFTGVITFKKKAEELQQIATDLPLEKILVETDAPYLTPEPYRGKRNEPTYVKYIAEKIAELKGLSFDQVADQTTKNAKELFKI